MPSRLNKRQQREQEELLALKAVNDVSDQSSDNGEVVAPPTTATGFAALFSPEEEDEKESEEEGISAPTKARKSKKKKKKSKAGTSPNPATTQEESNSAGNKQRKATLSPQPKTAPKNIKGKSNKKDAGDDLDQALAELSIKYPELKNVASSTSSSTNSRSFASLLAVSLPHLDSEAEMRKFFGARVVTAAKTDSPGPSGSRRHAGVQRSQLTRPQAQWWPAKLREGMSLRSLTDDELARKIQIIGGFGAGDRWWTIEYSKKYKGVTLAFMQAVMGGDPEVFTYILQKLPYHADTLLQLSEVSRHREEYSQAVDFVDRALFAYERAFVGAFSFTSGINRLDFDRVENRPFFLAVHRQAADLQRRGCFRTAFEFARLLYSLDPWSDPHGALLHFDYLAIKSGMNQWLLDVYNDFHNQSRGKTSQTLRSDPSLLPGWAYARALAFRMKEENGKEKTIGDSTDALKQAILAFPSVILPLADKADISLSAEARSHNALRIRTDGSGLSQAEAILHALSHLYAQRSSSLWKAPKYASWLASTVSSAIPLLSSQRSNPLRDQFLQSYGASPNVRYPVYRHLLVLETTCRNLFTFIPREIINMKQVSCDPLPPLTSASEYNEEFFRGAEDAFAQRPSRRSRGADQRALERLVPDPAFREQLQAFFDAHPQFAQRFPGGILHFAQALGNLPDGALEDMMAAELMNADIADGDQGWNGGHGMPGHMPGEHDDDEFDDVGGPEVRDGDHDGNLTPPGLEHDDEEDVDADDAEDDEEDVTPLPVRVIRNLMNRFWGATGGASAGADESSEESDTNRDDSDVD